MKKNGEIDRVGLWYLIGKSLGRNDINIFRRATWNPQTKLRENEEIYDFSHSEMDGAGAMVTYMRQLGDKSIAFPKSDRIQAPKWWRRFGILLESQKLSGQAKAQWRDSDINRPTNSDFEVIVFMPEETNEIRRYCKERSISINAFFIKLLHSVCAPFLLDPSSRQAWLVPVNMRGGVEKKDLAINHSSAVPLFVADSDTAKDIHEQLKKRLKDNIHWGAWWAYNLGARLGKKRMTKLLQNSSKTNFWMGTLSDMGIWNADANYNHLGTNEIWFATPPGSPNYPIGCVHLTFEGRLSIAIKVHPFISSKPNLSHYIAKAFEEKIRMASGIVSMHNPREHTEELN